MRTGVGFRHAPAIVVRTSRRRFLRQMAVAGALSSLGAFARVHASVAASDDEALWNLVRDQFPLRPGFTLMNAANLCPSPFPVSDAVAHYTRDIDVDASFQNRVKFAALHDTAIGALARYMNARSDEIVLVRNTTEGNNVVVGGLDLGPGDEVVLWDQNHPSNNVAWDVRAHRSGFTVRRVTTPVAPESHEELMGVFADALTSRTRVLSFSHLSNVSGVELPAKALCALARERGIWTHIDGAQTFGVHALDLHAIGCDSYAGSAHKWFLGPKEGGLLYVRHDRAAELWPSVVGVGWEDVQDQGARRFGALGQRDDAMLAAMGRTVEFLEIIGNTTIDARVRLLANTLKEEVRTHVPGVQLLTPMDPALSGGVVLFAVLGMDMERAFETLYETHGIGCALMGETLRFCPHIYNPMDDVYRVVEAVQSLT